MDAGPHSTPLPHAHLCCQCSSRGATLSSTFPSLLESHLCLNYQHCPLSCFQVNIRPSICNLWQPVMTAPHCLICTPKVLHLILTIRIRMSRPVPCIQWGAKHYVYSISLTHSSRNLVFKRRRGCRIEAVCNCHKAETEHQPVLDSYPCSSSYQHWNFELNLCLTSLSLFPAL